MPQAGDTGARIGNDSRKGGMHDSEDYGLYTSPIGDIIHSTTCGKTLC